jgi:hypothetical protein
MLISRNNSIFLCSLVAFSFSSTETGGAASSRFVDERPLLREIAKGFEKKREMCFFSQYVKRFIHVVANMLFSGTTREQL